MADNYLEKRFEDINAHKKVVVKRNNHSLDTLLHKNRSCRGYDKKYVISHEQLKRIVEVNSKLASAMNRQVLRFKLVTKGVEADKINECVNMGMALKEFELPFKGTEPEAFIIVCSILPEDKFIDIDLGISLQSMLLKAVEMGLNGLIICAFDKKAIQSYFSLEAEPLAVLAIGKSVESIFLRPVRLGEDLTYYRKDGVHYVPKIITEDLYL